MSLSLPMMTLDTVEQPAMKMNRREAFEPGTLRSFAKATCQEGRQR